MRYAAMLAHADDSWCSPGFPVNFCSFSFGLSDQLRGVGIFIVARIFGVPLELPLGSRGLDSFLGASWRPSGLPRWQLTHIQEGLAEFWRLHVTDPLTAATVAPQLDGGPRHSSVLRHLLLDSAEPKRRASAWTGPARPTSRIPSLPAHRPSAICRGSRSQWRSDMSAPSHGHRRRGARPSCTLVVQLIGRTE